jgi:hypothetical protein
VGEDTTRRLAELSERSWRELGLEWFRWSGVGGTREVGRHKFSRNIKEELSTDKINKLAPQSDMSEISLMGNFLHLIKGCNATAYYQEAHLHSLTPVRPTVCSY